MIKKSFKKSYGSSQFNSYSKEYMDAYMEWRKTLTQKQIDSIEDCNEIVRIKDKKKLKKEFRQRRNYYSKCKNPMP